MRAWKLLAKLTIYYAVIGAAVFIAVKLWPSVTGWLPIGGVEQLISAPTKNPLEASEAMRARPCRQPWAKPVLALGRDRRSAADVAAGQLGLHGDPQ